MNIMNNLSHWLVRYRYYIRAYLVIVAWSIILATLFVLIYLPITDSLAELVELRSELPVALAQRDAAVARSDGVLRDFSTAIKDKDIQNIYVRPLCGRLM